MPSTQIYATVNNPTPTVPSGWNISSITSTVTGAGTNTGTVSTSFFVPGIPPIITSTSPLPEGIVGRHYYTTLRANGTTPITWSIVSGRLPDGLSLNNSNGVISGIPTAMGRFNFRVRATNSVGFDTKDLSISVGVPTIITPSLPRGTVGISYHHRLMATGLAPIFWSRVSGNLPNGLTLDRNTGIIAGTPTATGTSNFTLRAENAIGSNEREFSIIIVVPPYITTPSPLPPGNVYVPYFQTLHAIIVPPSTPTWSLHSGSLPPGLKLYHDGVIAGIPTTTDTFSFVVRVADRLVHATGYSTKNFDISIGPSIGPIIPLTGGHIEIGGRAYFDGENMLPEHYHYLSGGVKFISTPDNATIRNIQWIGDEGPHIEIGLMYPNFIESPIYTITGIGGSGSLSVTVNEGFADELTVEIFFDPHVPAP